MRVEATADVDVPASDLYAIAADLRNLPEWWIEHLGADVATPAARPRDTVYRVRYQLPGGMVIGASCTVIAARVGRSLTYVWEGGGLRVAVGQTFSPTGPVTCRARLVAEVTASLRLRLLGPIALHLMMRNLEAELERALTTLSELATARTIVRRGTGDKRAWRGRPEAAAARDGREGT